MKIGLVTAGAIIFVASQVHAQECKKLLDISVSQTKAAIEAQGAAFKMYDVAMMRLKRGADFEQPIQLAYAQLIESRGKAEDALATLDKMVKQKNCVSESETTVIRVMLEELLEQDKGVIDDFRKEAHDLGVKLPD